MHTHELAHRTACRQEYRPRSARRGTGRPTQTRGSLGAVFLQWASVGIVMILLAVAIASLAIDKTPSAALDGSVTVRAGDSLWTIAQRHPVEGLGTLETVELIRDANALGGSAVHTGQMLRVPRDPSAAASVASR